MDKVTADLHSHSQWLTIVVFSVIVPFVHDKKHYSAMGVKGGSTELVILVSDIYYYILLIIFYRNIKRVVTILGIKITVTQKGLRSPIDRHSQNKCTTYDLEIRRK